MPDFSIIIPLYNKESYVSETIQSVLNQTHANWELLIVNNGSTDNSVNVVRKYNDSRIKLMNSLGQGPGVARNYGIKKARGEWIQFLDADDLLKSDHLEKQLEVANAHLECDIVVCRWEEFVEGNKDKKLLNNPVGYGMGEQALKDGAIAFAPWAIHAASIKRNKLNNNFYWPEPLDRFLGEDIAFWFKLVNSYKVAYGWHCTALYRTQTPDCRTQNFNPEKWFLGVDHAIKWNLSYLQLKNQVLTKGQCENLMRAYIDLTKIAKQNGNVEIEIKAYQQAKSWLDKYLEENKKPKIKMILRKILGINITEIFLKCSMLKKLLKFLPSILC